MASAPKLNHEKLDVYQAAICFVALAAEVLERFPRGHSAMADQLRRAAFSIPLNRGGRSAAKSSEEDGGALRPEVNIAEGYGKRSIPDRARSYDIARGSAHECGAIWDVARLLGVLDEKQYEEGKIQLHRTVSMLVRMVEKPR